MNTNPHAATGDIAEKLKELKIKTPVEYDDWRTALVDADKDVLIQFDISDVWDKDVLMVDALGFLIADTLNARRPDSLEKLEKEVADLKERLGEKILLRARGHLEQQRTFIKSRYSPGEIEYLYYGIEAITDLILEKFK